MTKIKIFIDFEAIAPPFSRDAKLESNFPFAYTMGIYIGKKFKTCTFVFNFHNYSAEAIDQILHRQIIHDIRYLLKRKTFIINNKSIEFVGWNPNLEKKIIANIFPDFTVSSLNKGMELSLSRLTPEIPNDYFEYLKKIATEQIGQKTLMQKTIERHGAVAAYAGYLLHAFEHNVKGKFVIDGDKKIILNELRNYSRDDVMRMAFLNSHPEIFKKRRDKAYALIKSKNSLKNQINKKERFLKTLKTFNLKKTGNQICQEINNELTTLDKKKTLLEKEFDNI